MKKSKLLNVAFRKKEIQWPNLADGETLFVREMSAKDLGDYIKVMKKHKDDDVYGQAFVTSRCVCDSDGATVFDESDINDLMELPRVILQEVSEAILSFNKDEEPDSEGDDPKE